MRQPRHSRWLAPGPTSLLLLFCMALLAACASGPSLRSGAEAQPRAGAADATRGEQRLRVMFLGDNGHHQPWRRAQQLLPVFAGRGIDVFYTDRVSDLNEENLRQFDALMFYGNYPTISREQTNALLGYVENGGGLVVVHSASASFPGSEEYIRLVGGAFRNHGVGTFSTVTVRPDHPAVRGVPDFESWDETYMHQKLHPDNVVLSIRREGNHEEPWTWVRDYGRGRVFYTAWGHDQRTWGHAGFHRLLEQGTRWAAGDRALALEVRDPPAQYIELEVPLPNYPAGGSWGTTGEPITRIPAARGPAESASLITVPPGFRAELFAAEPDIVNPIDIAWDERGRLWVLETVDYPNEFTENRVGNDRLLILEDTNGDGRADRTTVFAEGLNIPTAFAFANGGVIVAQAPDMLFLQDSDGDGRADVRRVMFTGWRDFDTHAGPGNLRYGLDNRIWGSVGYAGFEGTVGGTEHNFTAGLYRFARDGSSLEFMARTSNNTWGLGFSEEGYVFGSTANRNPAVFLHVPAAYYRTVRGWENPVLPMVADRSDIFPIRSDIRQVDQHGHYTAGTGLEVYTARAFPREFWNRAAFVAEPTGHLLGRFELETRGSTYLARNRMNMLASRDAWTAPTIARVGPDGALWVVDWYNLVIQHNPTPEGFQRGPGNAYATPNRDRQHGRIYRIVHDDAPRQPQPRLHDATPEQLVQALRHDNMFWRLTAQRLLVESADRGVAPALLALLGEQRTDEMGLNPGSLHALWTLDGLGLVRDDAAVRDAVRRALHHPAAPVRRAAIAVLPRDQRLADDLFAAGMLPDRSAPEGHYVIGSNTMMDADPQVRLATLLAASELAASPRIGEALTHFLLVGENARDRWIPDAVAVAAARHDAHFLAGMLQRRLPPGDSAYQAGVQHAVRTVARHHAAAAPAGAAMALLTQLPAANETVAAAFLEGLTDGWPEDQRPALAAADRTRLTVLRGELPTALVPLLDGVAAKWGAGEIGARPRAGRE